MKKSYSFIIEQPKPRYHKALFDEDLPFMPKVIKPKNRYKRKEKYRNKFLSEFSET